MIEVVLVVVVVAVDVVLLQNDAYAVRDCVLP